MRARWLPDLTPMTNYGHITSMRVESGKVAGLTLHLHRHRQARECRALFDADLDLDHVRHVLRDSVKDAHAPVIARVTVIAPGLAIDRPVRAASPKSHRR